MHCGSLSVSQPSVVENQFSNFSLEEPLSKRWLTRIGIVSGAKHELVGADWQIRTIPRPLGFAVHKKPDRARLAFQRKNVPATKWESGSAQELSRAAKSTAFGVQVGQLCCGLGPEIEIQSRRVIIPPCLAEGEESAEIALVRRWSGGDEHRQVGQHASQTGIGQRVILAVEG